MCIKSEASCLVFSPSWQLVNGVRAIECAIPPVVQAHTGSKPAPKAASAAHGARSTTTPGPSRSKPAASKQASQQTVKAEVVPTASHRSAGKRMTPSVKRLLKVAVDTVWKADSFGVFKLPVTKRVAPDYYQIVKQPMDLKTVRQNLDKGAYEDELAFKHVCGT